MSDIKLKQKELAEKKILDAASSSKVTAKQFEVIVKHGINCMGADINAKGFNDNTALHQCVSASLNKDREEKLNLILEQTPNLDAKNTAGETPLMVASNEDDFQTLIDAGADFNAQDNSGQTALMRTSESVFDAGKAFKLLEARADTTIKDKDGLLALHYARRAENDTVEPEIMKAMDRQSKIKLDKIIARNKSLQR